MGMRGTASQEVFRADFRADLRGDSQGDFPGALVRPSSSAVLYVQDDRLAFAARPALSKICSKTSAFLSFLCMSFCKILQQSK